MLFKRREKPSFSEKLRTLLWPRSGWRRTIGYAWQRVKRMSGTPHEVAMGFACGAFASFTPLMGFHFVIGFLGAMLTRGHLLASAFGTFVGNPVSFPFIWYGAYSLGKFILGGEGPAPGEIDMPTLSLFAMMTNPVAVWTEFSDRVLPVFMPMLVGGIPLGILGATICYFPVRWAVQAYQAKRRRTLARCQERGRRRAGPVAPAPNPPVAKGADRRPVAGKET